MNTEVASRGKSEVQLVTEGFGQARKQSSLVSDRGKGARCAKRQSSPAGDGAKDRVRGKGAVARSARKARPATEAKKTSLEGSQHHPLREAPEARPARPLRRYERHTEHSD